jgi:hypothetical protein
MVTPSWLIADDINPIAFKNPLSDSFRATIVKAHWMQKTINELREKSTYLIYDRYLEDIIILCKFLFQEYITEDEYMRLGMFYTPDILQINQTDNGLYSIRMNLSEIINTMLNYIQSNYHKYCLYSFDCLDISDIFGEFKMNSIGYRPWQRDASIQQILYKILNEEVIIVSEDILKDIEYYLLPQKIDDDEPSVEDHDHYGYNKGRDNIGINTIQCEVNYTNTNSALSDIHNKRQMDCEDETHSTKRQKMQCKENKYQWKIHIYWNVHNWDQHIGPYYST